MNDIAFARDGSELADAVVVVVTAMDNAWSNAVVDVEADNEEIVAAVIDIASYVAAGGKSSVDVDVALDIVFAAVMLQLPVAAADDDGECVAMGLVEPDVSAVDDGFDKEWVAAVGVVGTAAVVVVAAVAQTLASSA